MNTYEHNELSQVVARRILETVGGPGEPPEYGFQFFTAGLDPYLTVINEEYLATFIKQGGSAFKMVVGVYGGGKTHFLYCIRDLAWKHRYAVSYVSLSSGESPFHRLDLVYGAIARSIVAPLSPDELLSGYERGIPSFVRRWYSSKQQELRRHGLRGDDLHDEMRRHVEGIDGVESLSFARAVKAAYLSLLDHKEEHFIDICQWLSGEGYDRHLHRRHGILHPIDRTRAFPVLRSLVQWVQQIGYSGLLILLDEAERVPSLSTRQREQHLGNLREVIDECGRAHFQRAMVLYAVPDENFLDGRTQIYEALRQRTSTVFETLNPTGVKIELEQVVSEPIPFLHQVGERLARVFETAYDHRFDPATLQQAIATTAEGVYALRFGDIGYKRLFVQKMTQGLRYLHQTGSAPSLEDLQLS